MVLKFLCLQSYINFCNKSKRIEFNVTICNNNVFYYNFINKLVFIYF
jgi:hypothetical protein